MTLDQVFAPYCPTCDNHVLLGTRRIVAAGPATSKPAVRLRCFCGTIVAHDARRPLPLVADDRLAG